MKHGKGMFKWPDKNDKTKFKVYDGDWVKGYQHGLASYTNRQGQTFKSKWENGKWLCWIDKNGKEIRTVRVNSPDKKEKKMKFSLLSDNNGG